MENYCSTADIELVLYFISVQLTGGCWLAACIVTTKTIKITMKEIWVRCWKELTFRLLINIKITTIALMLLLLLSTWSSSLSLVPWPGVVVGWLCNWANDQFAARIWSDVNDVFIYVSWTINPDRVHLCSGQTTADVLHAFFTDKLVWFFKTGQHVFFYVMTIFEWCTQCGCAKGYWSTRLESFYTT